MAEQHVEAVHNLERQVRQLRHCVIGLGGLLIVAVVGGWFRLPTVQAQTNDRILRVRGIVVEDEAGRERILIGAPIPAAANRVRTNETRVRQLWAGRFPDADRYMGFYKDYRHSTNGILILDDQGFDRLALGDPVPDPNIGKRVGPSTGMVVNDEQGFERSGYGLINVDGKHRVVLGLDSAQGREGLTLSLYDEGSVALSVRDRQQSIYVGGAPSGEGLTGTTDPFFGLLLRSGDAVRFAQNAATR